MDDLNAASLDDVKEWFKNYYGAANAVLVHRRRHRRRRPRRQKVEQYFGDIPPGPPVDPARAVDRQAHRRASPRSAGPRPAGAHLQGLEHPRRAARSTRRTSTWPPTCSAQGKTSRLYKRLVYDDQIATDVSAYIDAREIGGQFADHGHRAARRAISPRSRRRSTRSWRRFSNKGPPPKRLERVKTQYRAGFVRGVERIGGFGGKSDILAQGEVLRGQPDSYKDRLERVAQRPRRPTCSDAAQDWLADGVYVLEVHPFPGYSNDATEAPTARKLPEAGDAPEARSSRRSQQGDALERPEARAGRAARRCPSSSFGLLVDAGYAADQFAAPGTASLADGHARRGHQDAHGARRSAKRSTASARICAPARTSTPPRSRSRRSRTTSIRRSTSSPT